MSSQQIPPAHPGRPASPSAVNSAISSAAAAVLPALRDAASKVDVDFDALFNTARLESGFNPNARARTSSATGLFQFIDATWLETLKRHGARHGIAPATRDEALALRRDPQVASLMAAEHMADNAEAIEARTGRAATTVDLYLAHFLGSGGAATFLAGLAGNPAAAAATMLPAAARANKAIFFDGGTPRTLQQVHDLLARRLDGPTATPLPGRGAPHPAPTLAHVLEARPLSASPKSGPKDLPAMESRRAAQVAYLLLADLGA
jgi:hypothetical protein